MNKIFKLPKPLKAYEQSGFIVQQRAKFVYYLCVAALSTTLFVLLKTSYNHLTSDVYGQLYFPVLTPIIAGFLGYFFCLILLIRGYYNLSANLILVIAISIVWFALIGSEDKSVSRVDAVAYVFVVLSMVPLLIKKGKYLPFLYSLVSIGFFSFFVFSNQDDIGIYGKNLIDYIIDTSLSFILIGFIGYNIFSINKAALDRAEEDIKERKEAESAFAKSEKKYREMAGLLPQTIYEADINGKITYINQAGLNYFQYSEQEFNQGITLLSLVLEKELLISNIEKCLKGNLSGNQYTALRKNGEKFPVQVYSSAIIEESRPVGLRGIIIDMTDRIKAEEALRESEAKYKEMTLLLPQTVYESDIKGHVTYINKAGHETLGFTENDIKSGLSVFNVIVKEDHDRLKNAIAKIVGGESSRGNQYTAARKDGSTFPVQVYSSVIKKDGIPVGYRGIMFDITERTNAEEEIKQSRELFKTLFDSTPLAITLTDLHHKIIMANKAFYRDLELTPEMVLMHTPKELGIKTDDEKEKIIENLLFKNGYVENIETTAFDGRGNKFELYVCANIIEINNQKGILRTSINVTDKKELENKLKESNQQLEYKVKERTEELATAMEELESTNQELQATNEELYNQRENLELTLKKLKDAQEQLIQTEKMASLGILTAGVAHEINNPINYIYNGSMAIENYIKEKFPDHIESLKPLFNAINTGIARTTNIIKSLNNYSRKNENTNSECNIHDIIDNCLTMLFNQYKNRIQIFKKYAKDLPQFKANESTLHQLFINVLTNAIQAIEGKGKISINTSVANDNIEIHITDTGKGISTENLKHIYDPFFTTKDPGKGTGLGLSIVQRIIQEHKGTIQCKSQLNKGTEIIVYLPINM